MSTPPASRNPIVVALFEQIELLRNHVNRLDEKLKRYEMHADSRYVARELVAVELAVAQEKLELLLAISSGVTVPPS